MAQTRDRSKERRGALHRNLNRAIQVAQHQEFQYVHLVQDDMQFVRPAHDAYREAERLLCDPQLHAFQVHIGFHRYLTPRWISSPDHDCYVHSRLALAHVGVLRLQGYLPLYPPDDRDASEVAASTKYREEGWSLVSVRRPAICWVPWPENIEFGSKRTSHARKPRSSSRLLVKPLAGRKQLKLKGAPLGRFPFHEDFVRPSGWWCLYPYEYSPTTFRAWLGANVTVWRRSGFRARYIPRPIGVASVVMERIRSKASRRLLEKR